MGDKSDKTYWEHSVKALKAQVRRSYEMHGLLKINESSPLFRLGVGT